MKSREELLPGTEKVEVFLSNLAVNGHVVASTQNQAVNAIRREYAANAADPLQNAEKRGRALQTKEILVSTPGTHRGSAGVPRG
jgi:hypothetical protein